MMNIGVRPTVNHNADHRSIEVHIFDFNEDIYDRSITLFFVGKIREEQKFQGIDQLKAQLMLDQNSALAILSKEDLQ
jgi:riboflavin kinase/FMN adenylyltransferase